MLTSKTIFTGILTLAILMPIAVVQAAPGDDEAVVRARVEYDQAMKGHDVGLQNAMKIQLSLQLAKAKVGKKVIEDSNSKPAPHSTS